MLLKFLDILMPEAAAGRSARSARSTLKWPSSDVSVDVAWITRFARAVSTMKKSRTFHPSRKYLRFFAFYCILLNKFRARLARFELFLEEVCVFAPFRVLEHAPNPFP